MVSHPRRRERSSAKLAPLAATDEFWFSPIMSTEDVASSESSSCSVDDDDDCFAVVSMPAAHHQLLSEEASEDEELKGHDHVEEDDEDLSFVSSYTDAGGCRQKLSDVKEQGGGSWLLGFARLSDATASSDDCELPGLVRAESDEDLSSTASDESSVSSASVSSKKRARGISFAPVVKVQPIPHSSDLSPTQRRRMYSTSVEVRANKVRNKKEWRYDGSDWRNVTEEWEMGVDMVTGELVHPAHDNL